MRPQPSAGTVGLFALLACGAVADGWVALRPERTPVEVSQMRAAAEVIEDLRAPGDLLVHSPLFSARELVGLEGLSMGPDLPTERLRAGRRALVLDLLGGHRMHGFGSGGVEHRVGGAAGLVVRVYPPQEMATPFIFDLYQEIELAKMQVIRQARASDCNQRRPDGGRACPGEPDWLNLTRKTATVNGSSTDCVSAHPTGGGIVRITLPEPPPSRVGQAWRLEVRAALSDQAVAFAAGASVHVAVRSGAQEVATLTVPNRRGWTRKTVPVPDGQEILLDITTANDAVRHFCVNAAITETEAP